MSLHPKRPAELVFAYLFSEDGQGRLLDAEAAINWLKLQAHVDREYMWLHFDSPHDIEEQWLQYLELSITFKDTLHEERRSSRLTLRHHGLFAVMNDVNYYANGGQPEIATLWVSLRQHWLLSAWDKPLRSVGELVQLIDARQAFPSPLSLVTQLLSEQADILFEILRDVANVVNEVEIELSQERLPSRSSLGHFRRDLVRMQRLLAPEPDSLFRLVNRPPKWARDVELDYLDFATENFSVAMRDLENLRERIRLLEEDIAARVSERTNHSLFILTSVTVISLPMTVVGALFGMNVGGLPLKGSDLGFWTLFLISLVMTLIAAWLIFRLLRKD